MSTQAIAANSIRPNLPLPATPPPAVRSDSDGDHDGSGPPAAASSPSVNLSGQAVGQLINVSA